MPRETELKFSVHGDFRLPDLGAEPGPVLDLRAVYYDTDDLRLAREGITLRRRECWTVKLPVAENVRDEIEVDGLAEAVDLLTAWLRGAVVAPVATLRTRRHTWLVPGAEIVDDEVSVYEGRRVVSRFREVEIETDGISAGRLRSISKTLSGAGAVGGEFMPKLVRALGARAAEPPDLPRPTPVAKSDPASAAVALSLRTNVRRLLSNDPGVRRDLPDAVHQMRVACRRMRSDLRTFGPLVDPGWAGPLREELAWLAGAMGDARDLEVLAERLPSMADLLRERRTAALAAGHEAIGAPRYVELLERLVQAAREPVLTDAASAPCEEALPPLVRKAWRGLARKARALTHDTPAEDFHRARILAKRARYAAEAVAPILGGDARRFAAAVERVQEVLGEGQDAAVAEEFLAGIAVSHPELAFEAGRLAERQAIAAAGTRERFFPVWRKVDRPKLRRWLS